MNCPKCHRPLPDGAAFCMHCGTPAPRVAPRAVPPGPAPAVAPAMATGAVQGAFDAQRKRNTAIIAVIVILALIAAVITGLVASGALKLGANKGPDVLQAQGKRPEGVLMAQGTTAPPVTQRLAEAPPEMPKEVYEWLEHLRRCEELKRELTLQQFSFLTGILGQVKAGLSDPDMVGEITDPDGDISKGPHGKMVGETVRSTVVRWTDLSDQFRKFAPPAECRDLADNFDGGLNGLATSMEALGEIVNGIDVMSPNAQADIMEKKNEAQRVSRTHATDVDARFKNAQRLLEQVCAKYNKKPWFSIDTSGSVGGVLGGGSGF